MSTDDESERIKVEKSRGMASSALLPASPDAPGLFLSISAIDLPC
jgi:hypothetical protein